MKDLKNGKHSKPSQKGNILRKSIKKHGKFSKFNRFSQKKVSNKEKNLQFTKKKQKKNKKDNNGEEDDIIVVKGNIEQVQVQELELEKNSESKVMLKKNNMLTKIIKPIYEIPVIYTGGKIILGNNEKELFCSCSNGIIIYNLEQFQIINKITQENEEISNFAVHPNSKSLVIFTKNNLMRHIEIESKQLIRSWKISNTFVLDMAIDKTGSLLAIGCSNGVIQVYDLKKGHITHNFTNNRGPINKISFHPEPQKLWLISSSEDHTVKIYDLITSSCLKSLKDFESTISNFTLFDDGYNLAIATFDNNVFIYEIKKGTKRIQIHIDEEINGVESIKIWSPNTKDHKYFLICGGDKGILKTLDLSKEDPIFQDHAYILSEPILRILKFNKSQKIGLVSTEQTIILLDYILNDQDDLEFHIISQICGYNDEIIDAKFIKRTHYKESLTMPEESIVYATNSNQLKIHNYNSRETKLIWGHRDIVMSIDTYGPFLISGSKDNQVKYWKYEDEIANYRLLCTFQGHTGSVGSVSISPLKGLFGASSSVDKTVKLWDLSVIQERMPNKPVTVKTAKRTVIAHEKDINCVKFSPNEKLIATGGQDKLIKIMETETLSTVLVLKGHKRGVWDVAFSPVERLLASASGDCNIKIWNLVDGSCLNTLEGHTSSVLKVQWICLGLEIISGGADGLIKLWNTKKMLCLNTFDKHEGKIWALDVTDNIMGDQKIMTGANDSLLCIWDDVTKEEEQKAKEESNKRILDQQQLNNLMREKKFIDAAKLAFDLKMKKGFINVVESIVSLCNFQTDIIYSQLEDVDNMNIENDNANEDDMYSFNIGNTSKTDSIKRKNQQNDGNVEDEENEDISNQSENEKNVDKAKTKDYSMLIDIVTYCIEKDMKSFILILRDMNTTSKYSKLCQILLNITLNIFDNEKFVELSQKYKKDSENEKSFEENIEILISFTERHFEKVRKYIKKSYLVDFVLKDFMIKEKNNIMDLEI